MAVIQEAWIGRVSTRRVNDLVQASDLSGISKFGRNWGLAKDYESLAATLASFVMLAAIQLGVRGLARG